MTPPPAARRAEKRTGFTLLELMIVIGIMTIMLVAIVPAVVSLSRSSGGKSAVSEVMNSVEQARSLALTSGSSTYVVFADKTTTDHYRCRAYSIFKDDKTFKPVAVTGWYFLPTGISFQTNSGLLKPQAGTPKIAFPCPRAIIANAASDPTPVELPFLQFDSNGMVTTPTTTADIFVNFFSGFIDGSGAALFTDKVQATKQKFDQIAISPFTGRARYIDPYAN